MGTYDGYKGTFIDVVSEGSLSERQIYLFDESIKVTCVDVELP